MHCRKHYEIVKIPVDVWQQKYLNEIPNFILNDKKKNDKQKADAKTGHVAQLLLPLYCSDKILIVIQTIDESVKINQGKGDYVNNIGTLIDVKASEKPNSSCSFPKSDEQVQFNFNKIFLLCTVNYITEDPKFYEVEIWGECDFEFILEYYDRGLSNISLDGYFIITREIIEKYSIPFTYDLERMKEVLNQEKISIPQNLTRKELLEFLLEK